MLVIDKASIVTIDNRIISIFNRTIYIDEYIAIFNRINLYYYVIVDSRATYSIVGRFDLFDESIVKEITRFYTNSIGGIFVELIYEGIITLNYRTITSAIYKL